jgi:hypothetical protein
MDNLKALQDKGVKIITSQRIDVDLTDSDPESVLK